MEMATMNGSALIYCSFPCIPYVRLRFSLFYLLLPLGRVPYAVHIVFQWSITTNRILLRTDCSMYHNFVPPAHRHNYFLVPSV